MSKLGIEIDKSIRRAVRTGRRGEMYPVLDSKNEVTGRMWKRACYCLSRDLPMMSETTKCPAHGSIIGAHRARTQNLGLRR